MFPRFATFKEGTKLTYDTDGCVFYFPATLTPYARQAKRLVGVDQDLGSTSAAVSGNYFFSIAKVGLLAGNSYLRFSGGRALETLVKQHAGVSLFVKHFADKQHFLVFL